MDDSPHPSDSAALSFLLSPNDEGPTTHEPPPQSVHSAASPSPRLHPPLPPSTTQPEFTSLRAPVGTKHHRERKTSSSTTTTESNHRHPPHAQGHCHGRGGGGEGEGLAKAMHEKTPRTVWRHINDIKAEYSRGDKTGGNRYSATYDATVAETNQECSLKEIEKEALHLRVSPQYYKQVQCHLMKQPHHNVANPLDICQDKEHIYVVSEKLSGPNLREYLKSSGAHLSGGLSEDEIKAFMRQLLLALQHLHDKGAIHRAIQLETFVFSDRRHKVLKMVDLDFCHFITQPDDRRFMPGSKMPLSATSSSRTFP
uniref:Protein kinase domain-containing protein n=1 Tax=Vitrella brassicaformis TaxID=1169539 RepID=A0A7S1KBI2_9ALVE|mmetsp:Transcript_46624/g.116161  ORF Transcript_46624/g.116161 Transcript_46624/m.116161 type:complete len:312 (+) Transcript_46624:61-996(+)